MTKPYQLIGVGIGPFNLSLAALLDKVPRFESLFLERKAAFGWHSELLFSDATMQTSYLKDLVTPVDPQSPYSFLNYLVQNGLFHAFVNTNRRTISRREFEMYCQWVSGALKHRLRFGMPADDIRFEDGRFVVRSGESSFIADNVCIGTGLTPRVPDCARPYLGLNVFHAKSDRFRDLDLTGKDVVVIGGGQTGVEVFRNTLHHKWGAFRSVKLFTSRQNLEPLDESPFTNEYFTPDYVDQFFGLDLDRKAALVSHQKLASDGNTPAYLEELYNDLYRMKHVEGDRRPISILPTRRLTGLRADGDAYRLELRNHFLHRDEVAAADVVILCTGFQNSIPKALESLQSRIRFDDHGRFVFDRNFSVAWDGPSDRKIYAVNFSRHMHGISEPQTSLMSWRSATIVNDLLGEKFYLKHDGVPNFTSYRNSDEE